MPRLYALAAFAAILICAGCQSGPLAARRTLVAPAPTAPAQLGRPLKPRQVRLTGAVATTEGRDPVIAGPDAPGLLQPTLQILGGVSVGLSEYAEISSRVGYATYGDAKPNAVGVAAIPERDQVGVSQIGAGLRLQLLPPEWPLSLSLGLSLDWHTTIQGAFDCGLCGESARAALIDKQVVRFMRQDGHLQLGLAPSEWLYVYGFGGLQTTLINRGFVADRQDTLKAAQIGYVGLGAELSLGALRAGWHLMLPQAPHPDVPSAPWVGLNLGVVIGG